MIGSIGRRGAVALTAALAVGLGAGAANAQEVDLSFNLGATTDYVFRGISQSDTSIAVQGGADVTAGMFYAGVWASSIDFGLDEDAEVDFYAGVRPTLGEVTFDFGVIYYAYPGLDESFNGDMLEFKAAASFSPAEKFTASGAVYYSPEFTFSNDAGATYFEAGLAYAASDNLTINGALGRQDVDAAGYYTDAVSGEGTDGYTTWNVGASYAWNGFVFDGRYHDTDLGNIELRGPSGDTLSDGRFVASVKYAF